MPLNGGQVPLVVINYVLGKGGGGGAGSWLIRPHLMPGDVHHFEFQ